MKNLEPLIKAVDDAQFLMNDLTEANKGASYLEHTVLINIIEKFAPTHREISSLLNAIKEDGGLKS